MKTIEGKRAFVFRIKHLPLFVMMLTSILMFSSCSEVPVSDVSESTVVQGLTEENSEEPTSHIIDLASQALEAKELALSLEGYGAIGALNDLDLTIGDMLMYAVQDEYLARGEYEAIIATFGVDKPYTNIMNAEEEHLSLLKAVYASYGMEFPDDTSADHVIIPSDLLEAAKTGVKAEIDNITMYENFLSADLPDNVKEVFTALKKGSESHLLAFQKQVDRLE